MRQLEAEILIVDREVASQRRLAGVLEQQGYRTRSATSGEQALALVQTQPPDLVLLDTDLPGIDGHAVCQQLRLADRSDRIPVLFTSTSPNVASKVAAFQVGGVDYLTKPFEEKELVARLAVHVQLRNQRLELQQKNARLKGLLHTVAHDLRNPIVGMGMTLGSFLLQEQSQYVLARKMLERMWQSCQRQQQLIDGLVESGRREHNGLTLAPEPLALHSFASDLIEDWRPRAAKHEVAFLNRIDPDLPPLHADPHQLWRVYDNLIGNAIRHNRSGVAIALGAAHDGQRVQCTVTDNGVGIPRRVRKRLFAPYASGNSLTQSSVGAGMGLGLHICRQIVETHGGQIGVESRPGQGAQFWFALPLRLDQTQAPGLKSSAHPVVNGKLRKYLPDVSLNGVGA